MFYHYHNAIKDLEVHDYILEHGRRVSPRGLEIKEILNLTCLYDDRQYLTRPNANKGLAYVEGLDILAGYTDLEALRAVAPKTTERYYDPNAMSWYGEEVGRQMPEIIRELELDMDSRKALLYIGAGRVRPEDKTCSVTMQFLIRDDMLQTIVNMRSWDMYLGLPYDLPMFAMLCQAVRSHFRLQQGIITVNVGSAHIYSENFKLHPWTIENCEWVPDHGAYRIFQLWAENELAYIKREGFDAGRLFG